MVLGIGKNSIFSQAKAQEEVSRKEASRQAEIRMAGEALSALSDKDWIDVITVSLEERMGQLLHVGDAQQFRELAQHMDRRVDEEERRRARS